MSGRTACDTIRFHAPQWLGCAAVLLAIACALLIYSQTTAFYWDEGFHLLAAQLIARGSRPYLDFFFPQPPLNAYWNAGWMHVLGDSWRVAHAAAVLATCAAVTLASHFVYRAFQFSNWRDAAAVITALCFGLNTLVVNFATVAQAYALCLLLIVAAFRLCVEAIRRRNILWAAAAGICSGGAAGASLLTAPIAAVLLIWLLCYNRRGERLGKVIGFLLGAAVPLAPIGWLALHGLHQVFFNIVEYHLLYRQLGWDGALSHDAEIASSWIDSGHALLLGLLAAAAVVFALSQDCSPSRRKEYLLCVWIVVVESIWLTVFVHPTFNQYFVFVVPFLAILAPAGVRVLVLRFDSSARPLWPVLLVGVFLAIGVEKSLLEQRSNLNWHDAEEIARTVNDVTPPTAPLFADEFIYFVSKRPPPAGLAHSDAQKLSLPAALSAVLHVVPGEQLENGVSTGKFATVETCEDEFSQRLELKRLYGRVKQFKECSVYWDLDATRRAQSP